jgi:CDP-4-dehydro-6-deoxyglucose reductase
MEQEQPADELRQDAPPYTLRVAGVDAELAFLEGETVLDALRRAGHTPLIGCRRGGCAVCKVRVLEGSFSYTRPIADGVLTDDERAGSICLTCRAVPESDLVVAVDYEDPRRKKNPLLALMAQLQAG